MQRCLPPGVLLLPIMLTQDEATFDGNFRRTLTRLTPHWRASGQVGGCNIATHTR